MTTLETALSYAATGWPVFPCSAETKAPLVARGLYAASTDPDTIRQWWSRYPDAMIGVPTGTPSGVWVLDVDMGDEVDGEAALASLEAEHGPLPLTRISRTPSGGRHMLFTLPEGVEVRNRGRFAIGIDVRGSGGYFIAPGSVRLGGEMYRWETENEPADAPPWLLELVVKKQATISTEQYTPYIPGTNDAYVDAAIADELSTLASTPKGGRNNKLYDAALAIGTFVGAGAIAESEARGALEAVARQWDNFSLSRKTINNGLTDGKAKPRAIPEAVQAEDLAKWLPLGFITRNTVREGGDDDDEVDAPEFVLDAISLDELSHPNGLVEDLIDWIVSSAEQPSRTLALAAVLPLIAAVAGSRYSTGARDTRPNLYSVALAPSGYGKEHARSQIKRLLMESQGVLDRFSGPARIMSASALREVLEANPSVCCQIDEFGGFVRDITDRNAGGHQRAISTDLRDYFSASTTYFEGAAYRGSPPKRIYNPNLNIHGTSTPEQFWSALSSASAEDGLLPRLVLFHVTGEKPVTVKPQRDVRWVPHTLLSKLADIAGIDVAQERVAARRGPLGTVLRQASPGKPHVVPWTAEATALFDVIKQAVEDRERRASAEQQPFVRRILENAVKIALIAAVGLDPVDPTITEHDIEWGSAVAWSCAATMLEQVSERLADNQREANFKRIAGLIRGAGSGGITMGRLVDRLKSIDGKQRDEIIRDLRTTGKVRDFTQPTKGRPTARLVWSEAA